MRGARSTTFAPRVHSPPTFTVVVGDGFPSKIRSEGVGGVVESEALCFQCRVQKLAIRIISTLDKPIQRLQPLGPVVGAKIGFAHDAYRGLKRQRCLKIGKEDLIMSRH